MKKSEYDVFGNHRSTTRTAWRLLAFLSAEYEKFSNLRILNLQNRAVKHLAGLGMVVPHAEGISSRVPVFSVPGRPVRLGEQKPALGLGGNRIGLQSGGKGCKEQWNHGERGGARGIPWTWLRG